MCDELHDPFEDQVECARYRAERDMLAQAMERVADDIERTFLGFEGAEDAPAMRWAREFRAALGSLHSPVRDASPSDFGNRLVPEEIEWPKYTDGSLVEIGDTVVGPDYGEHIDIDAVKFHANGFTLYDEKKMFNKWYESDDRFERPAKVLDADGVEIRVGDTVYHVGMSTFDPVYNTLTVTNIRTKPGLTPIETRNSHDGYLYGKPEDFTHRAPVLAADGRPLRKGEHVYHVETGAELVVKELPKPGEYQAVVVFAPPASHLTSFDPDQLTHERPDSWERLEEDAEKQPYAYCVEHGLDDDSFPTNEKFARDLVRRAKALAERGQ